MFVSLQWSVVISNKSHIRNNKLQQVYVSQGYKAIKATGGMGRDRFLNKFVIPYVTLVSDENRPLITHKHFETPCIPL